MQRANMVSFTLSAIILFAIPIVVIIALTVNTAEMKNGVITAKAETKNSKKTKQKPKGLPITVTNIEPETIQLWKQYSGSIVAVNQAEIRPQVSGRITKIQFEDGQQVNKDDILIVIDPRPFQATLKQAQATLATAQTRTILAQKELERTKKLVKKQAVSESLLDQRENNYKVSQAQLLSAQAQIETAQINVDYAHIKAPISGKISRAEITEGNLVQAGPNAPLLTNIVANDYVYIDFEIDEQTYMKSIHHTKASNITKIPVQVHLAGSTEPATGFMHSFDNRIDPSSGTIRGRALFKNIDEHLLPGMTVSVKMGLANTMGDKQILLTERAIGTDQDRKFVYVVNKENKATYREVKIGQSINGKRIILSGLKQGDIVITQGLMRVRPNTLVSPTFPKKEKSLELKNKAPSKKSSPS